jgi:hypothetical protein
MQMPMPMGDHAHDHMHMNMNPAGMYLMNMASGTSMNPLSYDMPMLMPTLGSWSLMLMGDAFIVNTQQAGPRGFDKLYSANMFMAAAVHKVGRGSIMLQGMFSLEPATISGRSYPLLFQTGETAYGRPLIDAQHPHNFFMDLGIQYARPLGHDTWLQLYYAPVGDPALGPVAYPHRASAAELPQAPISHHWQDSTHIASDVATVALKHSWLRFEASGFFGTEPGENRWTIPWGGMNSYSGRLSAFPRRNWMFQVSSGRLARPEREKPGDVVRTTASAHYTRPQSDGMAWSTSIIWGRNHELLEHRSTDAFLVESVYPFRRLNFFTGRVEFVEKDELLVPGTWRIGEFTAGYTRDIPIWKYVESGIGFNASAYTKPAALDRVYGDHPWGLNMFLRFRLRKAGS